MRLGRAAFVCGLVAGLAVLPALAAQDRQREAPPREIGEIGSALTAPPPTPQPVLELASALSRPPPRGGLPAEPAELVETTPFILDPPATERRPVKVALIATGPAGALVQSLLATDLTYAREVRVADESTIGISAHTRRTAAGLLEVELTLSHRDPERRGALVRNCRGDEEHIAGELHEFADDALELLTGSRGAFSNRLVFARRVGPGRKDVYQMAADGSRLERVTDGEGIAAFPTFGPDGIFYSVLTPLETRITRTGLAGEAVIGGAGTHMGPTVCDGRLFFASTREGNTDIWTAALDGTAQRRLTEHDGIEVSPICAPDGRIAFVSDRTGLPQIWSMNADGEDERIVMRRGAAAQTPSWCGDRIALTSVGGGQPMRVVVYDLRTETERQLSPSGGGAYKDPVFSPDCRMIAWVGPEGIEIVRGDGRHRRLIAPGAAETIRWSPLASSRALVQRPVNS
jgi:Tol biopolymer transport system component